MNCAPTLTRDEFKTIHNSLYYLDCLGDERVSKIVEEMRGALGGAYAQDESAFDRLSTHYNEVKRELGLTAIWSMYEVENLSEPHPFEGALQLAYREHWGDKPVFVEIVGSTWAALYVAADAAIRDSGDEHHVFIESITPNPAEPRQLRLTTGS